MGYRRAAELRDSRDRANRNQPIGRGSGTVVPGQRFRSISKGGAASTTRPPAAWANAIAGADIDTAYEHTLPHKRAAICHAPAADMLSKAMDRDHPVAAVLMETTHMMFKSDLSIVRAAEAVASVGSVEEVLGMLRRLSAMDFGRMLLEMPNPGFPALSKVLPRMAKTEVQTAWTGNSGYEMFRQIKDFVLRLELYFEAICRRTMRDATILDFGCGWGRLARMMAYYTNPDSIWCLDPLRESVNICKETASSAMSCCPITIRRNCRWVPLDSTSPTRIQCSPIHRYGRRQWP